MKKDSRFEILRVIGLACILLCHYALHINTRFADGVHDVLAPMGNFIFFLISGILMGMKWDASGKAKHGVSFLVRCFKRIYYPLWWFLGLYFAIMCIAGIRIPLTSAVMNVLGGCWLSKMYWGGHLWFITLILSFYAIVFVISRWGGVRKVVQCTIVVACSAALQWLLWAMGIKQAYIVAFWMPGCLMFLFYPEFEMLLTRLKQRRIVATVIGLGLAVLGYAGIVMLTDNDFISRSWIGAFCGVVLIAIFLLWCRKDISVPLIGFVSGISFDIYLSHSLLRFYTVRHACGNDFVWFFVYIVGAFAMGTALKYSREKFLGLFARKGCER